MIDELLRWYDGAARDLPWRQEGITAYGVLVSEVMLQQTPVSRVVPAWTQWVARWPDPATLARAPIAEAVRQWGRLGYPRRALRLHAACTTICSEHGGFVPSEVSLLEALPGVGAYTARAVAAFAFGQRVPVVDVNVRRVVARLVQAVEPGSLAVTRRDLDLVEGLLPEGSERSAPVSIALMELGALVCTARAPDCGTCPVAPRCGWLSAGRPADPDARQRRSQSWAGTDRQARGRLMAVLRESPVPVAVPELAGAWDPSEQRVRALQGLIDDGLVELLADGSYSLPGAAQSPSGPSLELL